MAKTVRAGLLAVLLLAGCASTPRENLENTCNFVFLIGIPAPLGAVVGAAICAFGPGLTSDEPEEPDEREDPDV